MTYIENNLLDGEKVLYQGKVSLWAYFRTFSMAIFLMGTGTSSEIPIVIIIGVLFFCYPFIDIFCTEIAITNKRVMAKYGIISRQTYEINLAATENAQLDQSIIGRMFDFGTLWVGSAGAKVPIADVDSPVKFRNKLSEIRLQGEDSH